MLTTGGSVRAWQRILALLLGLLASGAVAWLFHAQAPSHYQATARVLIVLPEDSGYYQTNPFLNLPSGLAVLASVIAETIQVEVSSEELGADEATKFEVGLAPREPTITVSIEGADPGVVERTRDRLVDIVTDELLHVQLAAGTPTRQLARAHVFQHDDPPHGIGGNPARATIGILATGALLSTILVSWGGRRRAPARYAGGEDSGDGQETTREVLPAQLFVVLYILLLFGIPTRLIVGPIGAPGSPANLLAMVLLLWWVCWLVSGRLARGRSDPLRVAVALFLAASLAAYASGHHQGWYQPANIRPLVGAVRQWRVASVPEMTDLLGSAADRGLLALAGWVGIVVFTSAGLRTWSALRQVVHWLVGAAAVVAALGVVQYVTGTNIASYIRVPGLTAQSEFGETVARQGLGRVVSTSTHPIELAVIMGAALPLALHVAFTSRRLLAWVPTILIGVAALLTISRSGVVVAGVAMVILFLRWPMRRRLFVILALPAAIVVGRMLFPGLLGTIRALFTNLEADPSVAARTEDFGFVAQLFMEQPLFGRGLFTFVPFVYRTLDNQLLVLLIEVGIIGTLALLGLFLLAWLQAFGTHLRAHTQEQRHMGLAIAAALAAVVTSFVTFDTLGFKQAAGLTFLLVGLANATWRLGTGECHGGAVQPEATIPRGTRGA